MPLVLEPVTQQYVYRPQEPPQEAPGSVDASQQPPPTQNPDSSPQEARVTNDPAELDGALTASQGELPPEDPALQYPPPESTNFSVGGPVVGSPVGSLVDEVV